MGSDPARVEARGIVAAPFLPMHADQSIDFDALAPYLAWIAKQRPAAIASRADDPLQCRHS